MCFADRLSFEDLTSYHLTSHNGEVANLLKASESIDLCLSFANRNALIPIVVQNDGFAAFLPKVEEPPIPDC